MPADDDRLTEPHHGAVLDPAWEVELRAGQGAEGEQGSVEDELAVIHLLRHARAPEGLTDAAFERGWSELDAALDEQAGATGWRAWLRRPWLLGGGAALAAAAAAVLVVVWTGPAPGPAGSTSDSAGSTLADNEAGREGAAGMSATIEAQFAMLEPRARAQVERSVNHERQQLRGDLVAAAIRFDADADDGGAP